MLFDECVKFLTFELVDTSKVSVPVGTVQGGDTPLYRVQLSSSTGQNKVNGQLGIFSIVNGQATIFL